MSASGEYLYVLRPVRLEMVTEGPTEEELPVLERHSAYLRELGARGVVRMAGRTQNDDASTFGVVIFRAETPEEARRIMTEDPAVDGGLMTAELFPYRIAVEGG